ncbi:hypothetical protein [Motilibacter aurantiacus]|uniref:hypothetical protein n=1 Tax=Motilibacter aurantiacus TaxID=2714955 RepID=UPI00140D8EC8|nr:hypothetical protein [Motilibacter aurantiacus]NHC46215.1 hypothetical protein [Motilibacter aurantiacus]
MSGSWRDGVPTLHAAQSCPEHPGERPQPSCRLCPTPQEQARETARSARRPAEPTGDCAAHGPGVALDVFGRCLACHPALAGVREKPAREPADPYAGVRAMVEQCADYARRPRRER